MNKRFLISLALLLLSMAVLAHRLNDYLEATTISLSRGKAVIELRLTPGVAVAAEILRSIDLNGDHRISETEQHGYLLSLARDLTLTLDARNVPLKPLSSLFPAVDVMSEGTGDIIVEYDAEIGQKYSHHLVFKNDHYRSIGVYLVNCLLPADTGIHVVSQTRSANQSDYQLDFITGSVRPGAFANEQRSMEKAEHQAVIKTYFVHGIWHILTGYDHLLFLCALVLGAAGLWDLIKIVTAFTISHSLTLTLATLGYAHLPEQVIEPVIAASIVFVAIQNIIWPKYGSGYNRLVVAFLFGLFHGLGFAGGLQELMHAMPEKMAVFAILGFSLGVEVGNQLLLLPLYGTLQWLKKTKTRAAESPQHPTFQWYASVAVAIAGTFCLCADLYAFFK